MMLMDHKDISSAKGDKDKIHSVHLYKIQNLAK